MFPLHYFDYRSLCIRSKSREIKLNQHSADPIKLFHNVVCHPSLYFLCTILIILHYAPEINLGKQSCQNIVLTILYSFITSSSIQTYISSALFRQFCACTYTALCFTAFCTSERFLEEKC